MPSTVTSTEIDSTSKLTAALRAREATRPNRIYLDPYADELTDEEGRRFLAELEELTPDPGNSPCTVNYNAIRTRFFDDFLRRATHERGFRQVVMPAAGLDSRAYRLDWPQGTHIYEIDRGGAMTHKLAVFGNLGIEPRCSHTTITADLFGPWVDELRRSGYDTSEPSVWLLEGLLYYWREPEVRALLEQVRDLAAPGSLVAADLVNEVALSSSDARFGPLTALFRRWGSSWTYGADDPEGLWAEYGMSAEVVQPGDETANYGRWHPPMPAREVPNEARVFLIVGTRE